MFRLLACLCLAALLFACTTIHGPDGSETFRVTLESIEDYFGLKDGKKTQVRPLSLGTLLEMLLPAPDFTDAEVYAQAVALDGRVVSAGIPENGVETASRFFLASQLTFKPDGALSKTAFNYLLITPETKITPAALLQAIRENPDLTLERLDETPGPSPTFFYSLRRYEGLPVIMSFQTRAEQGGQAQIADLTYHYGWPATREGLQEMLAQGAPAARTAALADPQGLL